MKLAFSTLGCPDYTFEQIIACAERFGVKGIEVRGVNAEMEAAKIPEFSMENAEKTKALLAQKGLVLTDFGTSCSFHDAAKIESAVADGKETIDVCSRLNIPYIRVFGNDIQGDREAVFKNVAKGISALCEYGAEKGVGVLLETHGDFNTAEDLRGVAEPLKHYENFGVLWDVEHSDKTYGDGWRVFYEYVKPFVRHVHIKDYLRAKGDTPFKLTTVGDGEVPLADIVRTLLDDGYEGWFSLEWEKKWVPELPEFPIAMESFVRTMRGI